jgi:serine/threonine protein kinase
MVASFRSGGRAKGVPPTSARDHARRRVEARLGRNARCEVATCDTLREVPQSDPAPAIDGYVLGKLLGRGGFGSVFAAVRVRDGAAVAIKVAHLEPRAAARRLEHEAAALRVAGGGVAPALHEAGVAADGRRFLAMELLETPTLAQRMEGRGAWPLAELAPVALALARALEALHARGLVHRDLKPANIFVGGDPPAARLVDFGLVRVAGMETRATTAGKIAGTPAYMPPEVCARSPVVGATLAPTSIRWA